jgi:hypothetical protein
VHTSKASKRIIHGIALGDLHCGHMLGLTVPEYQIGISKTMPRARAKCAQTQRDLYSFYADTLNKIGPVDFCIANGDLIDGDGSRLNGIEQITTDRLVQAEMAVAALTMVDTENFIMTRGTPYHVGFDEEFEDPVCKELVSRGYKATIGNHEWVDIGGVVFDLKHYVNSSGDQKGRGRSLENDALWNLVWYVAKEQPKADVILRSHVHYFKFVGGGDDPLMMTLPALQAMGTRFGSKICSGRVHIGMVEFFIDRVTKRASFVPHIAKLETHKAKASVLEL